jgi:hypothetical protein
VYIKNPNIPVSLDIKELTKLSFPWHRCCYTIKQTINEKIKPVVKQRRKAKGSHGEIAWLQQIFNFK